MRTDAGSAVEAHVRAFFAGHGVEVVEHDLGFPRRRRIPGFRVLVVQPGSRLSVWTYVTVGCSAAVNQIEFVMASKRREEQVIPLLARVAYYHATHELALGRSLPIGRPWLPGSARDHLLVAEPSLYGPDLEFCADGRTRLLWLLPVTSGEISAGAEGIDPADRL